MLNSLGFGFTWATTILAAPVLGLLLCGVCAGGVVAFWVGALA